MAEIVMDPYSYGRNSYGPINNHHERQQMPAERLVVLLPRLGSISAPPTACLQRRYERAGTQNDHLRESFPTVRGTCPTHVYTHVCHTCLTDIVRRR